MIYLEYLMVNLSVKVKPLLNCSRYVSLMDLCHLLVHYSCGTLPCNPNKFQYKQLHIAYMYSFFIDSLSYSIFNYFNTSGGATCLVILFDIIPQFVSCQHHFKRLTTLSLCQYPGALTMTEF